MDTNWNIQLDREKLKGRSFLLGNKRAFSLSLPAAAGISDTFLHPHKWFGAYLYGRKFLEGQFVRVRAEREHQLGSRVQTGFTMEFTRARREYEVEGRPCTEEYFVADGINGVACTLTGDVDFTVEPEFDLRFYRALNDSADGYDMEPIANGCVISKTLPSGTYDDRTETFLPDGSDDIATLYAAVQVVGDDARSSDVATQNRQRRKVFSKDRRRQRFVEYRVAGDDVGDHAPLWLHSTSVVYAPVRLQFHGYGTVVYGFGPSRDEAISHMEALRDNLTAFQAQKTVLMNEILERSAFRTGVESVDTAYAHVLSALMNVLVARNAVAEDTELDRPATMILAGNGYFHDSWKRDENIALGFLLSLGFYDLAREVIRDTWQLQDETTGRLPQRIRAGEKPPYHSADGTLWALWRLYEYWRCTGDDVLLYEKLPMVERFFERSLERAVRGLLPSGRTSDPDYLWETWMDTPHTPRHGFPVEIQMLWLASLRAFRPLLRNGSPELEAAMRWAEDSASQALQGYVVRGMPADSLDENGDVRDLITPNPYFCFEVGVDLGPEVERTMRTIGRRQLAGTQGIVTLAPQDWKRVFTTEFLQDRRHVRGRRMRSVGKFNYHRGVEWNWLAQFFVQSELKYGEPDVAFHTYLRAQMEAALERGGIGGISELFDLSGARGPEFQAWSMSGFLESLQAFAGVRVDVPGKRITLEPQLPTDWPELSVRKWYGGVPFDLHVKRADDTSLIEVTFPWGETPDVELDLGLVVPEGFSVQGVDSVLEGDLHEVPWTLEAISGTARSRVRLVLPAVPKLDIRMRLQPAVYEEQIHTA